MKVIKWIAVAVMVAGFILALGTAGSDEVGAICFDVLLVRIWVATAMVIGGFAVAYLIEKKENAK